MKNAEFVTADAPEQMQKWKDGGLKPDVIFVDPPRRGLTEDLLDAVADMNPTALFMCHATQRQWRAMLST